MFAFSSLSKGAAGKMVASLFARTVLTPPAAAFVKDFGIYQKWR